MADTSAPGATVKQPSMHEASQHMDDIRFSSSSSITVKVDFFPAWILQMWGCCGLPPPTEVRGQGKVQHIYPGAVGIQCLAQGGHVARGNWRIVTYRS